MKGYLVLKYPKLLTEKKYKKLDKQLQNVINKLGSENRWNGNML